jgi:hypothetical protein
MTTDPETLYRQIGRLIEVMPDLTQTPLPEETHLWVARAYALVRKVHNTSGMDAISFSVASNGLGGVLAGQSAHKIKTILYRAFAIAEQLAPTGASGAFIPVGDSFDAFSALSKVLQTATKDVLIIDPFMDETALTEFGTAIPEKVHLRLMADKLASKHLCNRQAASGYNNMGKFDHC